METHTEITTVRVYRVIWMENATKKIKLGNGPDRDRGDCTQLVVKLSTSDEAQAFREKRETTNNEYEVAYLDIINGVRGDTWVSKTMSAPDRAFGYMSNDGWVVCSTPAVK